MKGTFFTADFVRTAGGDLKLLEINTDTSIQKHLAESRLDFSELISVLQSNSITNIHVVYKNIQKPVVDILETQLGAAAPTIQFNRVVEGDFSIYPTVVEDQADRFILRLAYDGAAIIDSEYAAKDLNVYKLFIDNSDASKIPGIYYAGSEVDAPIDTLEEAFNDSATPDFAVRKYQSVKGNDLSFYKAGNSSADSATRLANIKSELGLDGIITNYYKGTGSKASSIRLYQVVYGTDLDLASVGAYEIDAITDYPSAIDFDDSQVATKVSAKHFSEFSVEGINRSGGITADQSILRFDGGADQANSAVIGDVYKSYFVSGSPDTDNYGTLFQWSHQGSELPEGSFPTGSIMINSSESNPVNNAIIKVTLANGKVLRVGGLTVVLIHDGDSNSIKFVYGSSLSLNDSMFDSDGNKVAISSLDIELLDTDSEASTFEFNVEETDIYIVSGSEVILHNAPCFIPGTLIAVDNDAKVIEDVQVGELVQTYNHDTGEIELKAVEAVTVKENISIISIEFESGAVISCTLDHPFFVKGKGYASYSPVDTKAEAGLDVEELHIGDEVLRNSLEYDKITELALAGTAPLVYNLSKVADNKNFFANGFLVHNRSK